MAEQMSLLLLVINAKETCMALESQVSLKLGAGKERLGRYMPATKQLRPQI